MTPATPKQETAAGRDQRRNERPKLELVPISLKIANAFVAEHHRHNRPLPVAVSVVGVEEDGRLCGVAIIGRPVARMLEDGYTAEVRRVCTDGTYNACSMLMRAAWRATKALGYRKIITYTLPEEGGASLRAAGFRLVKTDAGGGKWSRKGRPARDDHPLGKKYRWELP